jgi:hypothetical protein
MMSTGARKETNAETLSLVSNVLDFIRGNLSNIERVWGRESEQFKSASSIMNQYLDDNLRRLDVDRSDLGELMKGLTLDEGKSKQTQK